MSILRKVPYIEAKLALLSEVNVTSLLSVINSSAVSDSAYSLCNGNTLKTHIGASNIVIEAIQLEIENGRYKNGFLIYKKNAFCMFLAYYKYQDLGIYEIDLAHSTYNVVREELTIEELRRILAALSSSGAELTPETLAEVLEGSETVVVDLNQEGDKLQVRLDQDLLSGLTQELIATREIAEGKVKGYVIYIDDNPDFDSQDTSITATEIVDENGKTISSEDLHIGDIIYTGNVDTPDRWYAGSDTFLILETKEVDLSGKLNATKAAVAGVGGLVVPTSAPSDTALVAVGTGNTQEQVYLGDGLELGNNTSPYVANVVGVVETNDSNVLKMWSGTQAEYDLITTKDANTIYFVKEQ